MDSAAVCDLCRLLLRQSDRHPLGTLDGLDLGEYDEDLVGTFLAAGLLVQGENLRDADGCVFFADTDGLIVADSSDDGGSVGHCDLRSVANYEIGLEAICRHIRNSLCLQGLLAPARFPRVSELGMQSIGRRRREYYLARALRGESALQPLWAISAHAVPGNEVVVLTPTAGDIPNDVLRRVGRERMTIVAVSDLLTEGSRPFEIDLPDALRSVGSKASARLVVDQSGHIASFDGTELRLTIREFGVLAVLATEAGDRGGMVPRDRLIDVIEAASKRPEPPQPEQLDVVISSLRRKLAAASFVDDEDGLMLLQTRRGVGTQLKLEPQQIAVF